MKQFSITDFWFNGNYITIVAGVMIIIPPGRISDSFIRPGLRKKDFLKKS